MICDKIENWRMYEGYLPTIFAEAFNWLENNMALLPKAGRYDLNMTMYAIVQNYPPKSMKGMEFENHQNYIDLQVVVKGEERILWTKPHDEKKSHPYVENKDIEFFTPNAEQNYTSIILRPGDFAIFWPSDWHIPCLQPVFTESSKQTFENVDKIVVKIPVRFASRK